jgi:predicted dehydrogenase
MLGSVKMLGRARIRGIAGAVRARGKCDVVVVGCGVPDKGMGWFHATQLLANEVPSARLTDVVEPFFLAGDVAPPAEFQAFQKEAEAAGVRFHASVEDVPRDGATKMALVAARTADCPALTKQVIEAGCSHVYLEKPGATTLADLQDLAVHAETAGAEIFMGYNKNVASYAADAIAFSANLTEPHATMFVHNNTYTHDQLEECFVRNNEGMLKNMAVHELCLLATYFGVTTESIASVTADKANSECLTLAGLTDFSKISFVIETKAGVKVGVNADRCGGNLSAAIVEGLGGGGERLFYAETPDDALQAEMDVQLAARPECMPYFLLQAADYITLKERVASHALASASGSPSGGPEGVATIQTAIATMELAEYLQPALEEQLLR